MTTLITGGFRHRILVSCLAFIGLALAIVCASYPLLEPLFVAIVAGFVGVGLQEYYRMAQNLDIHPVSTAAIFNSTVFIFAVYLSTQDIRWAPMPMLVIAFSFITLFVHFLFKGENPLMNFAVTMFGLVWITIPLSLLVAIIFYYPEHHPVDGRLWFIYLLFVTNASDSGAYFVGKLWGKRPLAAHISPNKTIEGAIGGLLAAFATSIIFYLIFTLIKPDAFDLAFREAIILGPVLGVMAQLGDLAESLLKRDAGVKDSNTLPGLGGVLDMVDSLIFTAPILYLFLTIR